MVLELVELCLDFDLLSMNCMVLLVLPISWLFLHVIFAHTRISV